MRGRLRDCLDDCTALGIEIIGQGSDTVPVHKRPRPRDDREPLAYLLRKFARALRTGEFQSQAPFGVGIAGSDIDQQFGQSLGAEGFEFFALRVVFLATWSSHMM